MGNAQLARRSSWGPLHCAPLASMIVSVMLLSGKLLATSLVGWHPDFVASIGRGLDLKNPDVIKPSAATIELGQPTLYSGTGGADINVYFSQHQLDLTKHFALNVSLSAKYSAYSGNVKFGYVDDTTYSGNTLNFVFECNRDFGTTVFDNATLAPQFVADVNFLKQALEGEALGRAVEDRFGTHFITGYKSAAKVVIIYTFTFESQTTARSLTASLDAKYNGGVNSATFHTDVTSLFNQNDSRVTLNYRFYSSDPIQLPDFPLAAAISNLTQFIEFAGKVEGYCKNMDPVRGKRTAYVVEEIKNLPGYLALMAGYNPNNQFNTDYDRFMSAYGTLKRWDELLTSWTIDNRRMSWMNTNGQRMVLAMRSDVSNYRRSLEAMAKLHFETGTPLQVTDDVFNYFANFNRIPLPQINIVATRVENSSSCGHVLYVMGMVDYGDLTLTRSNAFTSLIGLRDGIENSQSDQIGCCTTLHYSPDEFEALVRPRLAECAGPVAFHNEFFDSPIWSGLRQLALQRRLGFFDLYFGLNVSDNWHVGIKDGTQEYIDLANASSKSTSLPGSSIQAFSETEMSIASVAEPSLAFFDASVVYSYTITNDGPGSVYGIEYSMPVPEGMQALTTSGSQGQGTITNGTIRFEVGPMACGALATVNVRMVPLRTGMVGGPAVSITPGVGLTDPAIANNIIRTAPLSVTAPVLEVRKRAGYVDLTWVSDTGRLVPQSTVGLTDMPTWMTLPNGITAVDGRKTLRVPATSATKFFRLSGISD
jgi:hypothetical protein